MRYLRIPHRYEHFRKVVRGSAPLLCRSALRIFLAVALLVAATSPLLAQQFATLNVTVADPSGSVIAGAPVSVRNNDTGILRTELTDKVGLAVIPGLPAGQYTLTVNTSSFSAYQAPLTLTLGE